MSGMDSAMALDEVDLFGDPVIDGRLDLPTRPPLSKKLQQRLDELRSRGCSQGIAWSRQGTIASVSKDGWSLDLRFLRCHPDNGAWELSGPTPCPTVSPTPGGPICHLAWAPTSSPELAVIDAVGRITILSFSITLNRPYTVRRWDADPVDDLQAVVGCYWLPLGMAPGRQQFHVMYGPAVWTQNEYKFENSVNHAYGPWHPNMGKSALLCITTNGSLKLLFSQNSNRIEETSLELESVTSSDDLITHASICSDKNTLLIALATTSRQLKVVRVGVQWSTPQPADKQTPPGSMPLSPHLKEKNVAVTSWFQHGPSDSTLDTSMAQLSHIEMLPSCLEGSPTTEVPPVVLTVRSHVPSDSSPFDQEHQSIIDRWEVLSEQPQTLHSAFEQLGSKISAGSQLPTMTRLNKLESIIIPKIIVSIHSMQLGKVICFAFSDGTVQYRDRFTMHEIYNEHNLNSIMSLHQVGFQFMNDTPCLQVAFSPTNCSFVQICEDGSVKWNRMYYPMDDVNTALQGSHYNAMLAALSVAISPAAIQQTNLDDVLSIARPFTQKSDFTYSWIRTIVNMLKIPVDYSEESHHDQLVRNSHLQVCLSILNHLGFHGEFQPRSFGGKFAMLALNVRNIVILITIANNTPVNLKEKLSPLDDPEVVEALAGCAKWAVDLLSWLTDCIFNLLNQPTFLAMLGDAKRFPEISSYLQSRGDVSLHLLLCSSTRGFLSAACRRLTHLESLSNRATQFYEKQVAQSLRDSEHPNASARPTPALYLAYVKMQRSASSTLIKVQEFEKLVGSLSQEIRSNYQRTLAGLTSKGGRPQGQGNGQQGNANDHLVKKAQAHCELDMLLAGNPPPSFRDALYKFFHNNVTAFRNQTNPSELYFANFSLLEVDDDSKSLASRKARGLYIDVFKRAALISSVKPGVGGDDSTNELPGDETGPQWRRCVRCAAVMEDVYGHRPGFTFVLAQQRKCSCGGNWGLLPKGSLLC
ncbi:RNA polymerase II mediator complex subunit Sin4 [Lasiosphaeris hirsuta]|uniref:Mediator of RNA polymerase II transcription subunit 16 n=1 Tax=Lasiosphaeris hirsuta TaxID=260670 RepID=A0AA40E6W7_9PEZI|nr:RNA polymerase II mediator complex subunit Sin4 [Lasiosphaeris hirsuta]